MSRVRLTRLVYGTTELRTFAQWAALWRSVNRLDGDTAHLIYGKDLLPRLFKTRAACRAFIETDFGYIRDRPDLRGEPHGWRIPQAVLVDVVPVATPSKASKGA